MSIYESLILATIFLLIGLSLLSLARYRKVFISSSSPELVLALSNRVGIRDIAVGIFFTASVLITSFWVFPSLFDVHGFRWAKFYTDVTVFIFLIIYVYKKGLLNVFFRKPVCLELCLFTYLLFLPSVGLAMIFCNLIKSGLDVQYISNQSIELQKTYMDTSIFYATMITTSFLAPVSEEIMFRGFFQNFFSNKFGSLKGVFITSLLFSLIHYKSGVGINNLNIISHAFIFSLFAGFLYNKTASLYSSTIFHITNNSISSIFVILSRIGWF